MKKTIILFFCFCFIYTLSYAQDEIMDQRDFDIPVALSSLESIQKSLSTFRDITDLVFDDDVLREIYSKKGLIKIQIDSQKFSKIDRDEMSWTTQSMITPNNILRIKGVLMKTEMELQHLYYENTLLKKNSISQGDIIKSKEKYVKSKEAFENFIHTHYWYE